ncbi:MAG: tetratricopeptide repeat protein, partial [Saprospiraceae bacterium]|nr:tetratricopeptide repeat protein [Saprospiraceae bacterium]
MINRLIITFCLVLSIIGKGSGQEGQSEARLLLNKGLDSLNAGYYEAAGGLLAKAMASFQQSNQKDTTLEIELAMALGEVNIEMRDYVAAMGWYQKAVAAVSTQHPIDTALLRDAYDGRSWAYSKMYKPLQSIRDLEKVYAIDTALHGSISRDAANTLMNMGLDYYKAGYFFDAEDVMLEALKNKKKVSEPNAVDFNRIYNNLGIVYRKMGDLERALIYAKKALEIKLENYPPRHPSVAKYYMNIGTVLTEMGQSREAVPYLEENLAILKETFPSKNLNITSAKGELANVLADAGRYEEAIQLHLESLETEKTLVEESNPYHIAGYFNLAQIYLENSKPQLALDIIKKVEKLEEEATYFPFHKKVKTQLLKAEILDSLGRIGEAKSVFERQLESIAGTKDFFSKGARGAFNSFQEKELVVQLLEGYAGQLGSNPKEKENQWKALDLAVELLEAIRKGYASNESARYLDDSSQNIYAAAVKAAFELGKDSGNEYFFQQVLQLADKARGNRLKKVLRQQQAVRIAGIPTILQDSLAQLKLW